MAFLRRGNVKRPYKNSAFILLKRFDGMPVKIKINSISCWEEYQHRNHKPVTVVFWDIASSTAVVETFDKIDEAINGKAVANV